MKRIIIYTCFIIAVISVSINPSMSLSTSQQRYPYLTPQNKPIIIGKSNLVYCNNNITLNYYWLSFNIGYSSNTKSGKAERAINTDGANIIIWSFLHLHDDDDDTKKIKTALDLGEIRSIRDKYERVMW